MAVVDSTANDALQNFTDTTGIPAVILVEGAQDVFGSNSTTIGGGVDFKVSSIAWIVLLVMIVIVVILIGCRKAKRDDFGNDSSNKKQPLSRLGRTVLTFRAGASASALSVA